MIGYSPVNQQLICLRAYQSKKSAFYFQIIRCITINEYAYKQEKIKGVL